MVGVTGMLRHLDTFVSQTGILPSALCLRFKPAISQVRFLKLIFQGFYGRGDRNRTCDPLHPMQVLYQSELHPDIALFIQFYFYLCKQLFSACTNR